MLQTKSVAHEMEATCDMGGVVPFGRAIHAAPVGIEVFFVCFPFFFIDKPPANWCEVDSLHEQLLL